MFFRWDAETCNPEVGPGLTKGMAAYLQNETATEILSGWAETSGERQCYPTAFKGSSGVQFHVRIPCDESREASGMMFESGFRNKAFKPGSCRCPSRHRRAPGIPSLSKYRCISERHTHTHTRSTSVYNSTGNLRHFYFDSARRRRSVLPWWRGLEVWIVMTTGLVLLQGAAGASVLSSSSWFWR